MKEQDQDVLKIVYKHIVERGERYCTISDIARGVENKGGRSEVSGASYRWNVRRLNKWGYIKKESGNSSYNRWTITDNGVKIIENIKEGYEDG